MHTLNAEGHVPLNTRGGLWDLPSRNGGAAINVPPGCTFLYLDPRTTTPNVIIGVKDAAGVSYMAPGDVHPLNVNRSGRIAIFNPLAGAWTEGYGPQSFLVGFVGLKAGRPEELAAVMASKRRGDPVYPGSVLWAGILGVNVNLQFPLFNLTGLRISCVPLHSVLRSIYDSPPADFTALLTPYALHTFLDALNDPPLGSNPTPLQGLGEELPVMSATNAWNAAMALAFAGGATVGTQQLVHDVEVKTGAAFMALRLTGIAGTNVDATRAAIVVEGR